jgi:hypothetical protein
MSQEVFAETLSVINVRNGVVRMVLVDQAAEEIASGERAEGGEIQTETKAIINMPMAGFLYMASVVQNLLADEKFATSVRKMIEAGLVNAEISDGDEAEQSATPAN